MLAPTGVSACSRSNWNSGLGPFPSKTKLTLGLVLLPWHLGLATGLASRKQGLGWQSVFLSPSIGLHKFDLPQRFGLVENFS